jgi:SAM-dependent methyltransferase
MSKDWTSRFFRAPVFTPGGPDALAAAPREAAAAWKALKLKPGSCVLDVACGTGRHAVLLARRGAFVIGVDKTPTYLNEARAAAKGMRHCLFARGDMRRLPFNGEFDAAMNLWTSFGYFAKESDDRKVLKGVARALKPGGYFLIELVDHGWVRKRTSHRHWNRQSDGSYLLQDAVLLEGRDPRVINEWTILRRGRKPLRARFVLRGYDKPRLYAALRRAGLRPLKSWTTLVGFARQKFNGRLVVLARKPA